jgi:membrane protease subunit HflC
MKKFVIILGLLIVTAPLWFHLALNTVLLAVDRTEFAYVTEFGRHVATYDGANESEAGLHWRWPWPVQSVQRIDRRLQYLDLPGSELLTHDPKRNTIDRTLTIVSYACWRITNEDGGVDRFVRRVGTPEQAKGLLRQRISSRLGAVIGQMEMEDLINTDSGKVEANMKRLRQRLLDGLQLQARQDYGIELVDLRLRRHSYPQAVRQAIFDRIVSERNKKVADYQSEGSQLAANIKSEAERDSRYILTEARARDQELRGQADADADRIRNAAHSKDVEFYAFLKKLEEYQRILGDNKTVLLLSSHRDLFDLLFSPPQGRNGTPMPNPVAGRVSPKEASRLGGPQ